MASLFEFRKILGLSLVVQWQRIHLPMQETQEIWVQSLSWEDPLGEEMTTHSSVLAWRIWWTEEPEKLQSTDSQKESDTIEHTHTHSTCPENTHLSISSLHLFPVSWRWTVSLLFHPCLSQQIHSNFITKCTEKLRVHTLFFFFSFSFF